MKRILIVETDPVLRGIYRRKFEMSGFQVEAVDDGAKALNLLPAYSPELILMDIILPGMEGTEVIRAIRTRPEFKTVPIIVLASFYRPDLARQAWEAGATKCVSKMDCTPNLALEIVEQVFSGDTLSSTPPPPSTSQPLRSGIPAGTGPEDHLLLDATPSFASSPSLGAAPRPPTFGTPTPLPAASPASAGAPTRAAHTDLRLFQTPSGATAPPFPPPPPASLVQPGFGAQPEPAFKTTTVGEETTAAQWVTSSTATFRSEVRQEFFQRVPKMQAELRDRIGALLKSKSPEDQLHLLDQLNVAVSALTGLASVTGYTRIAHLSGALEALAKELQKKPKQMTSSVLRTMAHASDCLNLLVRDARQAPQSVPQSILILAVDDEPISRRTIAVALGKASLRCLCLEDPRMALKILEENPFDLIFLDAEMPVMNGFELCTELRKLPTNASTPVIFVTSLTHFEIRARSSLSGGNDLIAKPFLMMELAVKALTYLLKPRVANEPKPAAPTAGQ